MRAGERERWWERGIDGGSERGREGGIDGGRYGMGHKKVPIFCKSKNAILPLHEHASVKNGTVRLNGALNSVN